MSISYELQKAQKALQDRRRALGISPVMPKTAVDNSWIQELITAPTAAVDGRKLPERVKTYPTLNLALLRKHAPLTRVYLLLKAYDTEGRGMVSRDTARHLLTDKESDWHCMSWRRLRQILAEGQGVTWDLSLSGDIYLYAPHRIARILQCGRLRGRSIYVSISDLTGGIKAVRAALYTSWHAGRDAAPIKRQTLRELSGVPESTQRTYDAEAETQRNNNIDILGAYTEEAYQEASWQYGHAVSWVIIKGKKYICRQLPNSYTAQQETAPKGRQKKHNRRIDNLVTKGTQGNNSDLVRLFYQTAVHAAQAANRGNKAYWKGGRALKVCASVPPRLKGACVWYSIG